MNERVKRLSDEIRKLPPEDQADLMDELLALTYREPDPEIEKAWAVEIEKRWRRFKSGLDPAYDSEEVLADIAARLAKRRGV
jgi:hypothetical protein